MKVCGNILQVETNSTGNSINLATLGGFAALPNCLSTVYKVFSMHMYNSCSYTTFSLELAENRFRYIGRRYKNKLPFLSTSAHLGQLLNLEKGCNAILPLAQSWISTSVCKPQYQIYLHFHNHYEESVAGVKDKNLARGLLLTAQRARTLKALT